MNTNRLIILAISASLCGCDGGSTALVTPPTRIATVAPSTAPSESWPAIQIDARHAMRDQDQSATPYLVKSAEGIVIDARKFSLRDPDKLGRRPNVVRILYNSAEYAAPFPQKGDLICTADPATIQTVHGTPFKSFSPGQRAAIGIGYEFFDGKTNRLDFREFWVAWVIFD